MWSCIFALNAGKCGGGVLLKAPLGVYAMRRVGDGVADETVQRRELRIGAHTAPAPASMLPASRVRAAQASVCVEAHPHPPHRVDTRLYAMATTASKAASLKCSMTSRRKSV